MLQQRSKHPREMVITPKASTSLFFLRLQWRRLLLLTTGGGAHGRRRLFTAAFTAARRLFTAARRLFTAAFTAERRLFTAAFTAANVGAGPAMPRGGRFD